MKKGFTLIELMAVIVVLGIIALIAIPMIANILKDSQESLFRTSIQNIINKVEETCQMEQIKNIEIVKEYTIENSILTPQIEIKGKMPISGVITLDNDCNVLGDFNDDKFIAHADSKAQIITITKK